MKPNEASRDSGGAPDSVCVCGSVCVCECVCVALGRLSGGYTEDQHGVFFSLGVGRAFWILCVHVYV